ncbi:MAG: 23S rRNA (adenine(2030)-N(6))-methyltransferase RlmJ [Methylovulum sp.]|jgi:23S rRNA (adenine2030-N6)-methyltransferase|nr:23S rRNA (adenine(2030)-N(6))-methyltransferase RlmJ [Methylovulum sp.]MCF7999554.1 23S rRNA (adenine(2030)-N(6))-methyltransferase RlmJ [Methylovulum sp.]
MLSYRHGFHAGNFADVLKHLVLIQLLDYFCLKPKPFCYLETHAGAGLFSLNDEFALKNREFDTGIGKLWDRQDLPEQVAGYVQHVKQVNPTRQLSRYPGSPLIAKQRVRQQDRLLLCELHSTDVQLLNKNLGRDSRTTIYHADGLSQSLKSLPPLERRGLILIDPSYELKQDYTQVPDSIIKMHKHFATGTFALWYPVIERKRCEQLVHRITESSIKNIQRFELGIRQDQAGHGMTASGMIIINPPWTLATQLHTLLPWLAEQLAESNEGFYRIETLVPE